MDSIQSLLSSAIAGISQLIVIDQEGNVRVVPKGTPLLPGEVVFASDDVQEQTSPKASIVDNDQNLNELELDEDIQDIFAALESGDDPTQLGDEFAAAAGTAASGSSLTTSGEIERVGAQSIAETSFDTGSLESQGLSRTQSLTLLESYRILLTTEPGPEGAPTLSIPEAINSVNAEEAQDGVDVLVTVPAGTTIEDTIFLEVSRPTGGSAFIEVPVPDDWDGFSPIVVTIPATDLTTDGDYTVTAEVVKPNGDSTSTSSPITFDLDTTPPSAPIVTIEDDLNDDGLLADDELEGQVTVTVSIPSDAEVGDVLSVTGQPDTIITQEMINNGAISFEYDRPEDGDSLNITATVTDQAGNTSAEGNDSVVTEDNTPTGAPVVQILDDANDDGILTSDENDGTVDVRITLPEGVKVGDTLKITGQPDLIINQEQIDVGFITVTYPAPGENETLTVNATITDTSGNVSAEGTDSVTGENINDNPVIADENGNPLGDSLSVSTNEDTQVGGRLTATDVDGDVLTFAKGTEPSNGTLTVDADGNWSYTPNENYNGNDSFTVIVSDGNGGTDTITVNVGVTAVNDDPTATAETASVNEDATVSGQIEASDVDLPADKSLIFTTNEEVKGLTLNSDGTYTFDASEYDDLKEGQELVITVPVTVEDDAGGSTTTSLTITVIGSNDPADVTADVANLTESDSVLTASGQLESTDPDGNDNTFKATTISGTYGVLTLQADGSWNFESHTALDELGANDQVTEQFIVETEDGTKSTIDINIQGTNDAPSVELQTHIWILEGDTSKTVKSLTVNDADANDSHTFTVLSQPDTSLGDFEMRADGSYTFVITDTEGADKLPEGYKHNETYQIEVKDSQGATTIVDVTVTITGTNDAAEVTSATKTLTETDGIVRTSGTLTHTDVDGADDTFKADTIESDIGTLYIHKSGEWQFKSSSAYDHLDEGESVTHTFNVFTEDGTPTTVKITIEGTNDAPVATADTATTLEDNSVTIDVLANDTDAEGNPLSIKEASVPANQGTVEIVDGKIVFTPAENFNGEATITYTTTDGKLDSEPTTVKVTVEAVNDDVGAVTDSDGNDNTVAENASIGTEVNITGLAVDVDGQSVTYTLSDNADGLFTIDPETGVVTVNGALDHETSDSHTIEITATSEDGSQSSQTFTINVSDIDEIAPEAPGVEITEDTDNDGLISKAELDGDVNVTISLTGTGAVKGDTLTVNGTAIELTQAHIDAGEVLTTVDAPAEGATLTVDATITDAAGNVSEKGTDSAKLDTTAAGAPGVEITEDTDNDGLISKAELDGDVNVTISLTGTGAVKGDTLTVNGTAIELTQAHIDAGEVLTTVDAPAEGATLTVDATITDAAGNVSEKGTDSAKLDTTAAGAPGVEITEDTDNDGLISKAELDGDVNVTISLTGTGAVKGDTLTVNGTAIELTQAHIDAGEVLTTVDAPAEGATLTVDATITDAAGNVSEKGTDSAKLDTTAAGAPGVEITEDTDNDGLISKAELDGDVNVTISLTGTGAVKGDTLTVNGTAIELTQAHIDAGEVLTTVDAPAEGATLTVDATITDAAGNVSEKGTDSAKLDTTAAGAPGVEITEDTDNDGLISKAELDGDVNVTISLTGTGAVKGDTLTVNGTAIELTQAHIDAGEVLTTVDAPAEGATLTVDATITDAAGNVSEKGTDSAKLDTTAAGAPGVEITEDTDNDGLISKAELDGDVNVTISLTGTGAVKGDTLTVNGTAIELTQAHIDAGEVLTTVDAPAEGATLTVDATITDAAGNVSEKGTDSAKLDTTAAGAPGVEITEDTDNDGLISKAELDGDVNVTISLTGTGAVKGDTLTVNGTAIELTQAHIDAGEVLTTVDAPAEGATLTVDATITDAAGNVSEKGTDSAKLDTTAAGAPGVEITEDTDNDGLISKAELDGDVNVTISLTGTGAVKGDTLTVNGTAIELTQAHIDAGEVLTTVDAPAEGATLTVDATITDAAGNVSEKGTDSAKLDTTAAGAPGVEITEDTDNDGLISKAELDGDVNVTISLTGTGAVKGDTLTVNGTAIELTQAHIDAGEVLTTVDAPAEGATLTVDATITDAAGNVSEKGTDSAKLDTTAAGAPGVEITEDTDNDGLISKAELDGDVNVTISLTGTGAVKGDTLTVNGTAIELTQAHIDAGEVLTTVDAPAEGATLTVDATITDAAGNVSEKGTDSAKLDTTAAGAPGVEITEDTDNDGLISKAELDGDVNVTISLTGTGAVKGDTLTVNGTAIELTQAHIDAGEVLTTVDAPAEGATLTVDATITDAAGNVSEKGTDSAKLDTTAAGAPGVEITEDTDNDGLISKAELDGDVNVTISLTGTGAVKGDTLTVNGTAIELTQAHIDAGEVLTTVDAPAEGATLTVDATITDAAGNVSEKGTDSAKLDTTAAGAPGVEITEDTDNDGLISKAELDGDVNVTISLTGTGAVKGDTLTVNGTAIELTQAHIDAGEVLTTVDAPAEGATLTVDATITDAAGNVSEKGTDSAKLDTTAAGAPGVEITEDTDNDGLISKAELDGDVNVTISLTGTGAVKGDTLTVNGTAIELTQAHIDAGEVLTTVDAPAEGATLTVDATITDAAGNVSEKGTDSAKLDTTAAGAPGVEITEDTDNDGLISKAELDGDVNVTISLTGTGAVKGDTLTVNGTAIELTQAHIDAGEVLTTVDAPAEGATLTVDATITDAAGNVSEKGTDSAKLDTTAAGAPGVEITEDTDNDGLISKAELDGDVNVTISLTGTGAVKGDTLTVNGTAIELTQAHIDAGEVLTTVDAPAEGATLTVDATITDAAGNVSEKGTDSAKLDTTAAGAPGVEITEDTDNDGLISKAELDGDVNVTISLTGTGAVKGDTLTVNGTAIELTQAHIDAGEVLTTVDAPAEGATLTVDATITDAAGNVSEKGTDSAKLDTTAAGAPGVEITEDTDNDGLISKAELDGDVNVTISLTGTGAVKGDTLTVNGTAIELTQAHIDAGEVLTTVDAPAEGATLTVDATITDAAGNVSEKGTDSAKLDTTAAGAPGVEITEDTDNDGLISKAELDGDVNVTISLTGTGAVKGDTLTVNGTAIELTQAHIDAGEVLTTVDAPAEGATLTVDATITDAAGNVSEKGTDSAKLDTTAAGAPGVEITEDTDNDGLISKAELDGDVNVTISLTGTGAVKGDTLTVNGTAIELTQAHIDAGEVLTTVDAPAEGATLTVDATITDAAGNVSEKGTDSAKLDTTAAGAPGVEITEDTDNDGLISKAELDGDVNVTISLTGTGAVKGDTLTVNGTAIELTQAHIDAGEVLTTVDAPAEGATLTVDATITDAAGNVSEKGTDSAKLDTTAAGAPGVEITEDTDNDGLISKAELDGDVNVTISLTGTGAVKGDTLTVNGTAIELTQAHIDAGEVLTTVDAPAEGATLTVDATITDAAGNVSEKGTDSAKLDTTAAGAPGVEITEDTDNDGLISKAELDGDVNVTISLTGTGAVKGDTLTVNGTAIELTQAHIDAGEVLTTVDAPAEGATLTVDATITDAAGNVSEKGTDSAKLDTTAAGAPGVEITEDTDNDGLISKAELDGDVNVTISLTGTGAVKGDTLTVNGTAIELTQAHIDAGEVLTTVDAPAEGATLTVDATITDAAGNVSEKGTDSAKLDTTAAGAPGVEITEDTDNDGLISKAELDGDVNVTISLTGTGAVKGDTLTVNGTAIELTQAHIDAGEVLTTVDAPAEGATLTVDATITDAAGNVSEKGTDSAKLDTTAAGAPGVEITEDTDNDGLISKAELDGDVNVTISLTGTGAVKGDTLTVNGTAIELTQAHIDAGEVLTTVDAPAEGATLTVDATITDAAGNVSEKGTDSAKLDTTAAGAPGVEITEDTDNDGLISKAELDGDVNVTISLTGTGAVKGDTLTVNGTAIELTQAHIDAGEVLTTVDAPAEGATLTVDATITDAAGNVSEKGTDSAKLDTTAAGAPGVEITEDTDNDGLISKAELDGDVNVTISLTGTGAVKGDTLTVNGTAIELTQAHIDAGEVLTTVDAPAEGATLTVDATITDAAGNVSEKGTDSAKLDTTAAGAPGVEITEDTDNDGLISKAELDGDVNVTISLTGTGAVKGDTLTVNGTAIELTQAHIDAGEVLTTVDAPAEGATLTVDATITDAAGNVSEKGTDSAKLDTTAAGAPGVEITEDTDNDGLISKAELDGDVNVTISLTGTGAVKGDTLTVNGTAIELTQAHIDAGEVLTTVDAPAEGATLTVDATITDAAGNVSEKGTDSAKLDTTAAGAPGVEITEDTDNDGLISKAELDGDVNVTISLTGTGAVKGDTLTVNGTAIELTQAHIDAGEVLTTVDAPAEGATLTVDATITDAAGNVSEKGTDSAKLDTTAAGAPGVEITEDTDNDGLISKAELDGDVNVTISLTGTGAVKGDTLTVNGTAIELTQAHIDAGEVLTTVDAPAEGATLTVDATITDAAGNVSEKGTDSAKLDTTAAGAPGVEITEDTDNDGLISKAELDGDVNVTISLTGTGAVKGDTLTVNGTAIELTQAHIDAGEVLTTVDAPAEGATLTVDATITDAAGNVSEKGTDSAKLDTTAAGAPGVEITEDTDNDGLISKAELDGDVNVTISLTGTGAVKGDTLTVNGTAIELTQAHIDAGEVLTTVDAPAEGATLTVDATITDAAGNVSEKGTDSAKLDTTAAGAPGVEITEDTDNDGLISKAELDGDVNVTISLTGTGAVKGDTLTVNGTAIELTQAHIDAGEVLTTVDAPAEGATLTVDATITDAAGNVSEKGTDSAKLDTTAAGAPGVEITEDTDNDGLISKAELDGDVNVTISLTGTGAVKGDTLTVNGTAIELTQAHIDAGEVLTTVDAPAEGATLTVDATITDAAGNVSEKGTDSAKLDTTAAGAPGVEITEDTDNDGLISKAELDGDVNVTISLTGTGAVKGDTLTVNGTAIELTQAHIDAGEVLTTVDAPAEGATLTVDATITDAAGNVSEKGTDSAKLDTTAAGAPGVEITEDTDNDGLISKAELDGDVNVTISLTGTGAVKGDTLTVNGTAIELTQAHIDAGEVLTTVDAPAEGATLTVDATITDAAGNVSEKGTDSAKLDTAVLTHPTDDGKAAITSDITDATNSGLKTDTITNDNTPDITGVTEAGATVTITYTDATDTVRTATGTADANGVYTIAITNELKDGANSLSIAVTDTAGNEATTTQDVTVDTSHPTISIDADLAGDDVINASEKGQALTISGTTTNVENGQLVSVTIDGKTYTGEVQGNVWSIVVPAADVANFEEGLEGITADVSDVAGNAATQATSSIEVDATVAKPTITNITDDSENSDYSEVTLHGTGSEAGNTIEVFAKNEDGDYVSIGTATVQNDLSWTLDISDISATPTNDNEFMFAKETDPAGNVSEASDTVHYYHGTYDPAVTEASDDYVLLGGGNDELRMVSDDDNDYFVADGGAHHDRAVFTGNIDEYQISINSNGEIVIYEPTEKDTNVFREFESFKFDEEVYTVEDLLKPEVTITSDTNNDEVLAGSEIGQNIAYQIDLPKGATVGTVLLVTLPSGVQSITLSEQQITSGKVEGSYVTPAEGSDFEVSVSITYPDGSQYGSTDTVHVNEGPEVNDFSVSSTSSVFDVPFSSHATDTEDDVDSSKTTSIVITSLPEFGTLYVINDDGSRTDLSVGSKVDDTSNIKYELDGNVNADFSFDATDYHGDTPINDLTEIALESGLVITGGSIADDGSLIQGTLNYHSAVNENGIGVNGNEVESDSKEYISIDFGDGTNVTEANISLGSLHDHYTDTDLGIDAKVHIELYKDGVLQKTVIVDSSSDIENSQYVANLQLDSGFDEVRLTTTAGQNSNFTLSNIEVVDSEINDEIEYKAVDSDGQESDDTAVVDITIPSSESALERAPVVNGDADLGNSAEDNAFVIDAAKLQLLLNTATDENQDDLFISALSVDESKGELVVTTNSHGQVTGAVFHPNENMSADDIKFDFTVSDGKLTDTGSAYLDVTPVADAPEVNVSLTGSPTHVYSEFPTFGMTYEDFLPENFDGTEFGIENTQIIDVWGERSGTSKRDYVFGEFDNGASYSISGGDGNDILVGAKDSKNDIRGDLGDDILVAGNGTDALYGSNHYDPNAKDVAILKGNSTDYEISKGSGFTSNDRWFNFSEDGANEVNSLHLHNIKYVQFEDGIFELDPDTGSLTKVEPTSSEYPLNIEASLTDVDGSETLTEIEISGLAQGDVLKDASGAVIGTASSDGTITLSGLWSSDATSVTLSGLTLVTTATNAAEISVTATSQEGSDTANTASGDDSIVLSDFAGVTMSGDGQSNTTGDTHDTIIGDTTGTVVTHGQDYNIAFMVDTSGSVGSSNIDDIEDQLEEVFDSLINSAKGEHSGTVNVMLVDFDTLAHTSVSVDLADAGAKDKLETVLDSLKSGGGTNYEDAFTVTNNWFETVKTTHPEANNMAYFITDGRPTYYNTDVTNPVVYNRPGNSNDRTLDDILNNADYVPGQTYSYAGKTIIDTHGKVYSYTSGYHYGTFQGFMRPDGTGKHEFVQIAGRGSYADSATLSQAELGFEMLESNGVTVEAIGIGSGLNEDQLKDFDSDGNVQTNVDADDLAEAILGTSEDKLPGADTISAGRGDDILFGDSMHMSGVSAQGYEGIKEYVAGKLNVAEVSDAQVHNYITENIGEFNQSTDNDKADHLHGNEGDDIIFGQGGNDYLYGGDDNDTLIGGLGSDILTGGDDSDVFKWVNSDLDGSTDSITDFHINEGDKLDLSDLFTDLSENEVSSMLDQIKGTVNGDDDHSSITVDRDGSSVTIDFEGVSATDLTNNLSTILLIKDD